MYVYASKSCARALAAITLSGSCAAVATDVPLAKNPVVVAITRGECAEAIKLINRDVESNDSQIAFVAGRMLDESLCVQRNPEFAARFFAYAAAQGNRAAQLDYAAKIGLGEGAAQDYANAGSECRAAGLDAENLLPDYVLGYVCTLRGLAGRLLRESLPANTFQTTAGAGARLEFNPVSGQVIVRAATRVSVSEASVGSRIEVPLVNIQQEVEKAWREAMVKAPKPDATRLANQLVEVTLDLDMTLEKSRKPAHGIAPEDIRPLQNWDIAHSPPPNSGP